MTTTGEQKTTAGERIVIGLTTTALVGLAVIIGLLLWPDSQDAQPSDEEERPPVVVSNGSVKLSTSGGKFLRGSTAFVAYHSHGSSLAPVGFIAKLGGSSNCTATNYKTQGLTITYAKGNDIKRLLITLDYSDGYDGAQMKVDAVDQEIEWPEAGKDSVIKIKGLAGHKITGLEMNLGSGMQTCTFDGEPEMRIRQVYKWKIQ